MEWLSSLLVLVCPLMMIFMMKGHMGHKKDPKHNLHKIEEKIVYLEKENQKLREELKTRS